MATMTDVTLRAGASTTTVSHVLNGTRPVAEATRERVLTAVDETGCFHNTIARSLVTFSTLTIGVVVSAISNPYFMDLVHVIEAEISAAGYLVLLVDSKDDPDEEVRIIQSLHSRRVDGYVFAPSGDPDQRALRYLARHGLPTVLVDRLASDEFDQVGVENVESTGELVDHLAALGHRRIALIGGQEGLSTTTERLAGYRKGLDRRGLDFEPGLVRSGSSDVEPARRAVHELLALADPPTALIAANNQMTICTLEGLQDLGLSVPEDMALMSFDDFKWAHLFRPRLTAMAQPVHEIGEAAARLLLARIRDPERPVETVRFAPRFAHRESCGCAQSGASAD